MFTIILPSGEEKSVKIDLFPAMDGWELQNRFVEFASTTNGITRRAYTMDVLAYAKVVIDGTELPLSTDAIIDNHLQTWQNVKTVFEEILMRNGIDPNSHAEKPHYWADAGAEMAMAFMASAAAMIGPAMEAYKNGIEG